MEPIAFGKQILVCNGGVGRNIAYNISGAIACGIITEALCCKALAIAKNELPVYAVLLQVVLSRTQRECADHIT